jgi:phosphonatase-like hydrolase
LERTYRTHGVGPIGRAEEVFHHFRDRGIRVVLNTGFDRDITSLLLDSLNWRHAVDAVVCGDDVQHGRPAPDLIFGAMEVTGITSVADVANVGDTTLDLQAGHNAGVRWNIGVLSGAHNRDQMERAPHTHLLLSVADLFALFP